VMSDLCVLSILGERDVITDTEDVDIDVSQPVCLRSFERGHIG
jgi:hypothetical protein